MGDGCGGGSVRTAMADGSGPLAGAVPHAVSHRPSSSSVRAVAWGPPLPPPPPHCFPPLVPLHWFRGFPGRACMSCILANSPETRRNWLHPGGTASF